MNTAFMNLTNVLTHLIPNPINFIPNSIKFYSANLTNLIPTPSRLYSSAGSSLVAALIGGGYGLIGRVIYPQAGIFPVNYAIWFAVAFQIKECINLLETRVENYMHLGKYLVKLERISEDSLDLEDKILCRCWKLIQFKNKCIRAIDVVVTKIFQIRLAQEIKKAEIHDACFIEMCRYRVWRVFKSTIINTLSFALAHRFTSVIGFILPNHTIVPLLLLIQSIFVDIIVVPFLHIHARWGNQIVDLIDRNGNNLAYRERWIRRFLPTL